MPDVVHGRIQKNELGNVLLDELEIGMASQVRNIVNTAGDEVVDANDSVATRQQQIRKVRPQETGRTGDNAAEWRTWSWLFAHRKIEKVTLLQGYIVT